MTVEQPQQDEAKTKPTSGPGWGTAAAVLVMLLLLVGGGAALVYYGIHSRTVSANTLAVQTREDAVLSVAVVHPKLGGADEEVVLPGNTQAFTDSPIYARTSGYLRKWYVDIGSSPRRYSRTAPPAAPATQSSSIAAGEGRSGNVAGQLEARANHGGSLGVPVEDGIGLPSGDR